MRHWCYAGTTLVLLWYFTGNARVLPCYYALTVLAPYWYYTGASLVITALVLHWPPRPIASRTPLAASQYQSRAAFLIGATHLHRPVMASARKPNSRGAQPSDHCRPCVMPVERESVHMCVHNAREGKG